MSGKFIDAYSVLQIGPEADDAAVRARHRELAKQFHPDRGGRAADGELMMRINRARDVLLDPVARATLDEELARRRGESPPPGAPGTGQARQAGRAGQAGQPDQAAQPTTQPFARDRRWRAEWGSGSPWAAPAHGGATPGPVPPPESRVRPSASRLRQAASRPRRATNNPALSSRQRPAPPAPPAPPPAAKKTPRPRPANPQPVNQEPTTPPQPPPSAQGSERPAHAWSLYAVPLDGVSVASLLASVLMCGPLGFILGIIGLARTAEDKRRGRWAAVAGIAISSLTMLMIIGYVMQAMSAPGP